MHLSGRWYVSRLCASDSQHQVFSHHNERPIEYEFALRALRDARPQTLLDVGTGTTAWPHLLRNCGFVVTAIDNVRDYWPRGMVNRHWSVLDVDIVNPLKALPGGYEAITCISVLEHIPQHLTAMQNMVALLAPGGLLVLTTPYSEHNPFRKRLPAPGRFVWPGQPVYLPVIIPRRTGAMACYGLAPRISRTLEALHRPGVGHGKSL